MELDRYDTLVPVVLAIALYALGAVVNHVAPQMGTSGGQLLIWGLFVPTVVLFHATVTINSIAHCYGRRRFDTRDQALPAPAHGAPRLWEAEFGRCQEESSACALDMV